MSISCKHIILIALTAFTYTSSIAQESDSTMTESQLRIKKTTTWAAALPGSGQIINRKAWKAPIVWGALGASGYYIVENTNQMKSFKQAWQFETDDDPLTVSNLVNDNGELYSVEELEEATFIYRRNRDLSYLSFFTLYLLQIVDANVDAHLKFFDANEDLSLRLLPPTIGRNLQLGITCKINL